MLNAKSNNRKKSVRKCEWNEKNLKRMGSRDEWKVEKSKGRRRMD